MRIIFSFMLVFTLTFFVYGKGSINQKNETSKNLVNSVDAGADSINISQMVAAQIEHAREKQSAEAEQAKAAVSQVIYKKPAAAESITPQKTPDVISISYDTLMKVSIIAFASIMALLLILFRRRRVKSRQNYNKTLKDNIRLLREEKLLVKNDSKLSGTRNKLGSSPSAFNYSREGISKKARELNISKGEIMLAQKIKAHELGRKLR